jgi:6-phosphogluconolactonase
VVTGLPNSNAVTDTPDEVPPGAEVRWLEFPDKHTLQAAAQQRILDAAARAIAERGAFHLVLSGGETPRAIYAALSKAVADWSAWHIYFGDERCAPVDDPERNSRMAGDAWLEHVTIPPGQIFAMPAELGATAAAPTYAASLHGIGEFDLVLLGLGEDGHVASLFPGHDWGTGAAAADALAVFDAPKPPPERVSLSANRLSQSREVLFLVSGEAKHVAVDLWRKGGNIPARAIMPAAGVDVLLESTLLVPLEPKAG